METTQKEYKKFLFNRRGQRGMLIVSGPGEVLVEVKKSTSDTYTPYATAFTSENQPYELNLMTADVRCTPSGGAEYDLERFIP